MNFDEYQKLTRKTDLGTSAQDSIRPGWLYYVLGIAGEAGEVVEKVKKLFRDKNGNIDEEFLDFLIKEMGDCLWYQARLADSLGISFSKIAETNLKKLLRRLENGTLHGEGDNR